MTSNLNRNQSQVIIADKILTEWGTTMTQKHKTPVPTTSHYVAQRNMGVPFENPNSFRDYAVRYSQ